MAVSGKCWSMAAAAARSRREAQPARSPASQAEMPPRRRASGTRSGWLRRTATSRSWSKAATAVRGCLLLLEAAGGEVVLGAGDVSQGGAVGEDEGLAEGVEGRDGDLAEVGQGGGFLPLAEVVVGAGEAQVPGGRANGEEGGGGGQPVGAAARGGGGGVADEEMQIGRGVGAQAPGGDLRPGLGFAGVYLPEAEEAAEGGRHRCGGVGGMGDLEQVAGLRPVAAALRGQRPRHEIDGLAPRRAEVGAPQGVAGIEDLPGPCQAEPERRRGSRQEKHSTRPPPPGTRQEAPRRGAGALGRTDGHAAGGCRRRRLWGHASGEGRGAGCRAGSAGNRGCKPARRGHGAGVCTSAHRKPGSFWWDLGDVDGSVGCGCHDAGAESGSPVAR
jgi:hypothetical protein